MLNSEVEEVLEAYHNYGLLIVRRLPFSIIMHS